MKGFSIQGKDFMDLKSVIWVMFDKKKLWKVESSFKKYEKQI